MPAAPAADPPALTPAWAPAPQPPVTRRPFSSNKHAPVLRDSAPAWWAIPELHGKAADDFDSRAARSCGRASRTNVAVALETTNVRKLQAWRHALTEVQRMRYYTNEPIKPVEVIRARPRKQRPPPAVQPKRQKSEEPGFDLEISLWAPRMSWADSGALWDTPEVRLRRFQFDWRCCIALGLTKVILREDGGDDGKEDEDGGE